MGSVKSLMPEVTVPTLNPILLDNDDLMIRMTTNEVHAVKHCACYDIDISGVVPHITIYVLDNPQVYPLILGRSLLYQLSAVGDYANHTYTIYSAEGQPHKSMGGAKLESYQCCSLTQRSISLSPTWRNKRGRGFYFGMTRCKQLFQG